VLAFVGLAVVGLVALLVLPHAASVTDERTTMASRDVTV
jgi:hypothetical protein